MRNRIDKIRVFLELTKNDFKNKFAGSMLGTFWAFMQPIVYVTIYWFIFEKGLKSQPMDGFPYLLWLIAGICPWFFFNEALNSASNSLVEYSYIVKKVKFPVAIIPAIKIFSALYVHCFFVVLINVIYIGYGKGISIYVLQTVYYSFCVLALATAISYFIAAISVFFKDMTQIVSTFLQYAMWFAPIMIDERQFPEIVQKLMKYNLMYYPICGYRDAMINKVWFWEHLELSLYFWICTFGLFVFGYFVFKRMRPHFADVL